MVVEVVGVVKMEIYPIHWGQLLVVAAEVTVIKAHLLAVPLQKELRQSLMALLLCMVMLEEKEIHHTIAQVEVADLELLALTPLLGMVDQAVMVCNSTSVVQQFGTVAVGLVAIMHLVAKAEVVNLVHIMMVKMVLLILVAVVVAEVTILVVLKVVMVDLVSLLLDSPINLYLDLVSYLPNHEETEEQI